MATPNDIVGLLKDSLGTLRQVLEELDKRVDSISLNKETEENEEIYKTKQLIDDLFEKSSNFKSKFYQKCKISKEINDLHSKSNFTKITDVIESDQVNEEFTLIESSDDGEILSNEAVKTNEINLNDKNNKAKSNPDEHISSKNKTNNDVNSEEVANVDKEKKKNDEDVENRDKEKKKNDDVENRDKEKKKNTEVNIEEVENGDKEKNDSRHDKIKLGLNKSILVASNNEKLDQSSDCNDSLVKIKDKEDNSKNNVTKKKNDNQKPDKDAARNDNIDKVKEKEKPDVGETEKIGISSASKDCTRRKSVTEEPCLGTGDVEMSEPNVEKDNVEKSNTNCDIETSEVIENEPSKENGHTEMSDKEPSRENQLETDSEKGDGIVEDKSKDTDSDNNLISMPGNECSVNDKENSSVDASEIIPDDTPDTTDKEVIKEEILENTENIDTRPRIRLVSLDKLMEKPRKTVTFDTSIIILTSSDEEGPPKKQNDPVEQNGTLRSVLKNSLPTTNKDIPVKESVTTKKNSEESVKTKKNSEESVTTKENSEESVTTKKNNEARLITKKKKDESESDDDTHSSRKSSRIKSKANETQQRMTKLKSIFKRVKKNEWKGKKVSDSDSDDIKSKKKKSVVDKSSDEETSKTKKTNNKKKSRSKTSHPRGKFSWKVYVPLPKVECEKLQEICSTNDNIFSAQHIQSQTAAKSLKRSRKQDSDSSSDSDKPQKSKRMKQDKPRRYSSSSDDDSDSNKKSKLKSKRDKNKSDSSSGSEANSKDKEKQRAKDKKKYDSDSSSEDEVKSKITLKQTVNINSSSSDDDFTAKKKSVSEKKKKKKVVSDSDNSDKDGASNKDSADSNSDRNKSDSDAKNNSDSDETTKKKSRSRIKKTKDSSESEEEISTRKQIRKLIGKDSLSETTKKAEAEEKERKARIAEKQKKYNAIIGEAKDATVEKVVLELDEKTEDELLSVDTRLANKLKPHQASGIRFMWDACFESLDRAKETKGSGCILAHCMGLGKTLQVIALSHTLLENRKLTGVDKILVVCPVNTVLNWKNEFKKWLPKKTRFEIFELVSCKQMYERKYKVNEWHEDGGVLIIGYTMFRNISNPDNKKIQKKVREVFIQGLVDPGPDLVICDEGHLLKNEKTHLSIAMNRIKTARRIVLTGTPLQNNLKEYWCMVQFIKPNLLGTYKEYLNRFVNPITNGQYTDSTQHDTVLMRKRSHVLHKLLDGVVQRRDYSVLEPYLPPKHEYVLFVRLSDVQVKLCQHYMDHYSRRKSNSGSSKVSFLFVDFQQLQRICTHPRVLLDKSKEAKEKLDDEEESEGSLKDFIDDKGVSSSSSSSSSSSGSGSDSESPSKHEKKKGKQQKTRVTRAQAAARHENNDDESEPEITEVQQKEWWQEFCDGDELDNINNSGKLSLLFHLLKECEEIGDKILVFSQSLYTLNCIEYFLEKIDDATQSGETEKFGGYSGSWSIGLDYFRLDGSSSCDNRATWCDMFNSPDNTRARLFLISTKAGGLGINLVAANRVIIFDVSWNPSHDIQSIYRVYRFGQTKPSYIYRFVTYGAMEMKIYERQVTKQAISKRVIDEQQIDRHYNQNDLQELYNCEFVPEEERPIPLVPKDVLLGEMLQKYDKILYKYHEHQSLLENKEDEGLNEEERKAAWEEFENEKVMRKSTVNAAGFGMMGAGMTGINAQLIASALTNIVRRDNPTWSDVQVQGIIPALVQQLKVQLSENDTSMYVRVQQEIQRMQVEAREMEFQRQMMQIYAQNSYMQMARQQMQNSTMGNMQVNPTAVRQMYNNTYSRPVNQVASTSGSRRPRSNADVIELND